MVRCVLNHDYHLKSFVVYFLFAGGSIARSETSEVDFLQRLEDALLLLFGYLLFGEAVADGVAAEARELDVVFVGEAAPNGFVDFFVEAVVVAGVEVGSSCLETFAGHFCGASQSHASDVLKLGLTSASDDDGGGGGGDDEEQGEPEPPGEDILSVGWEETSRVCLDVVDVAVEEFDFVFGTGNAFH